MLCLWAFPAPGFLAAALASSLLTWPLAASQPTPDPSNCSHRYFLSVREDAFPPRSCRGSCLQSSPSMTQQQDPVLPSCLTLWDVLELHGGNSSRGECLLELLFAPGKYLLPTLDTVRVQFSLLMSAPEGGVEFTCVESRCGGTDSPGGGDITVMMEFGGAPGNNLSVTIDGIGFRSCSSQLQFDEVSFVSINNCSFM